MSSGSVSGGNGSGVVVVVFVVVFRGCSVCGSGSSGYNENNNNNNNNNSGGCGGGGSTATNASKLMGKEIMFSAIDNIQYMTKINHCFEFLFIFFSQMCLCVRNIHTVFLHGKCNGLFVGKHLFSKCFLFSVTLELQLFVYYWKQDNYKFNSSRNEFKNLI